LWSATFAIVEVYHEIHCMRSFSVTRGKLTAI
jgi:hypothetical protein